jgi:hypothetical protein
MANDKLQSNTSKDKNPIKVFLIDRYVCNYISEEWMSDDVSNRSFGKSHGIHEGIVRKIKEVDGYKIPVSTLTTICFYKGIKMSEFFKLIEEKYGQLNDNFEIK